MEYSISNKEIIRRKRAFLALSIFLIIGLFLAAKIFKVHVFTWIYIIYFLVLVISNLWIKIFFKLFLMTEVYISKKILERRKNNISEKFNIDDIYKIKIKKNSNGGIREIYIYLRNGKNIFLNGINDFEKFVDELLNSVDKKTIIKIIREPIDFDSIFFYPVLGLILSFGTVYLLKWLTDLDYQSIKIFLYLTLIYIFGLGIYFVVSNPIGKRYGK